MKALLDKHRSSVKPPSQPAAVSAPHTKSKTSAKEQVREDEPTAEPTEKTKQAKTQSASKGKSAATKGSKGAVGGDEDGALLVMVPHSKEQRMKDEEKMRVSQSECAIRR